MAKLTLDEAAANIANASDSLVHKMVFDPSLAKSYVRKFGPNPLVDKLRMVATSEAITESSSVEQVAKVLRVMENCTTFIEVLPQHASELIVRDPGNADKSHKAAKVLWDVAQRITSEVQRGHSRWMEHKLHFDGMDKSDIAKLVVDSASGDRKAMVLYTAMAQFIRGTTGKNALKMYGMVKEIANAMNLAPPAGKMLGTDKIMQYHKLEHLMVQTFNNTEIGGNELRQKLVTERDRFSAWLQLNIAIAREIVHNPELASRESMAQINGIRDFGKRTIFSDAPGLTTLQLIISEGKMGATVRPIY
ncbi:MAG: hypothetical protein KGH58_02720 [Candidatus Micrarchaeota archaeon]|nr:hypothetical protein [Candidatus Micrarchaeota archaeon]